MVSVEELIGELLLRHNCVIIPSFGGFVAKQTGASIDYRNIEGMNIVYYLNGTEKCEMNLIAYICKGHIQNPLAVLHLIRSPLYNRDIRLNYHLRIWHQYIYHGYVLGIGPLG